MNESDLNITLAGSQYILIRSSYLVTMLISSTNRSAPQSSNRGIVVGLNGATLDLEQYRCH